jgi:hypothetical protein
MTSLPGLATSGATVSAFCSVPTVAVVKPTSPRHFSHRLQANSQRAQSNRYVFGHQDDHPIFLIAGLHNVEIDEKTLKYIGRNR